MTARSTRQAAEQAIIAAAYGLREALFHRSGESTSDAIEELMGMLTEHERLGLDATSQPAFSNNSTDTSAEAGASMMDLTGALSKECFDEIMIAWRQGIVGLTVDQLEICLHRSHQSVSARVNELRNKGWVVDSTVKRATRSGRRAIVWTPTQAAKGRP